VQAASDSNELAPARFSLVTGGPFYRLLCRLHLVRKGSFSAPKPAVAVFGLTWGVMAAVAGVEHLSTARLDQTLIEYAVIGRLWFAIPLFFLAESELDKRVARTMAHFEHVEIVGAADKPEVDRVLQRAERWRDSWVVEYTLLLVVIGLGIASLAVPARELGFLRDATPVSQSPSRTWYALVGLPMFQFLLARWLYRWALWSYVVVQLSKLPLRLCATHPDRAAGIALLADPTYAFSIFFAGVSSALAGTWSTQVARWHSPLTMYVPPFVLLLLIANLLAFGALALFMRPLRHARYEALRDYGHLALVHNRLFHARWVTDRNDDALLGAPDISSLADLQSAHDTMMQTRLFPFSPREAMSLSIATALPMVPAIAVAISLKELILKLVQALFSNLPG
jgi:hypothetical protein